MREIIIVIMASLIALPAWAGTVIDTSYIAPDGTRVIRHELDIPASDGDVYKAFTMAEGWQGWAVPFARLSGPFSVGADIETSYNPGASVGDAGNIRNRVLAYVPGRFFAFHVAKAPDGFPHADLITKVFTVAEIERRDAGTVHLKLSMLGYGKGEGYDALYAFFRKGNAMTMENLKRRFDKGSIDWKTELAPK